MGGKCKRNPKRLDSSCRTCTHMREICRGSRAGDLGRCRSLPSHDGCRTCENMTHDASQDSESPRKSGASEHALGAEALQKAIFNSANFSKIATDAKGVIQIFNVGAQRMLGYTAEEVVDKITPAEISDPREIIARAEALSAELETPIAPGFEALVFKASRGIEDIYELTYIRKDGSRFPAVVSVTALR